MPEFDLTGELSLKIELHMLRPITEKVHSGNGPVSLVIHEISKNPFFAKKSWNMGFFGLLCKEMMILIYIASLEHIYLVKYL